MKKDFIVYCQLSSEKFKFVVEADSPEEAIKIVRDKVIIEAVVPSTIWNGVVDETNKFVDALDKADAKSIKEILALATKGINNDSAAKFDGKNGLHR
jgi:nitrogen regulatory protein PII-like uncharacterized protein